MTYCEKKEDMKKVKAEKEIKKSEESLKHYQQSTLKESFTRQAVYSKGSERYSLRGQPVPHLL